MLSSHVIVDHDHFDISSLPHYLEHPYQDCSRTTTGICTEKCYNGAIALFSNQDNP